MDNDELGSRIETGSAWSSASIKVVVVQHDVECCVIVTNSVVSVVHVDIVGGFVVTSSTITEMNNLGSIEAIRSPVR